MYNVFMYVMLMYIINVTKETDIIFPPIQAPGVQTYF